MHAWVIVTVFVVAPVLWTEQGIAAPGEDLHRPDQPESFEQVLPGTLFRGLFDRALATLQEYVEVEGTLPQDDPSRGQSGEFRLKLFPEGKSRSQEHVTAEGSFRLAPDSDQREFTLRFKSSKRPQNSFPRSDDFI